MAEFVGFAIYSFPSAIATMGVVLGVGSTCFIAVCYWFTSLILWKFCLRHPEVQNVIDIGRLLGGYKWATFSAIFTTVIFVGNNLVSLPSTVLFGK